MLLNTIVATDFLWRLSFRARIEQDDSVSANSVSAEIVVVALPTWPVVGCITEDGQNVQAVP
ncbi:hypothetical protein C495_02105 [Natronorubrum sulfidifaciens JCM 14089]|uniref:Uncharacterized protein n=1 Tax=Natronorubrum sulfidifaciens JCM 14089 TaxID=1230460 RepID=L9WFI8_9EURY|nr:hypothetical protein C495_02105 [Natronorubrum sulfidifaciens JCM 14089]